MRICNNEGIENLRFAIVKTAVDDYKKMLKTECRLVKEKAKLFREHQKLRSSIKKKECSGSQFVIEHEKLKTERIRFGRNRKTNKDEIEKMENWFRSDYGQLLINVDADYIIAEIRKIVNGGDA